MNAFKYRCFLVTVWVWLLFFPAAQSSSPIRSSETKLGAPYTLKVFQPFLNRGFNTHSGWKGKPVDLIDPRLFLYHDNTRIIKVMVELIVERKRVTGAILKIRTPYDQLEFDEKKELNWFLVHITGTDISPEDVSRAFKLAKVCQTKVFKVLTQQTPNPQLKGKITKIEEAFYKEFGRQPTQQEVASRLGVSLTELQNGLQPKKPYYLTIFSSEKEMFIRLSLTGSSHVPDLYRCY